MSRFRFPILVTLTVMVASAALAGTQMEYAGSCLWTQVNDVKIEDNLAYCAYVNGLQIVDISDPTEPILVSLVYHNGGGQGVFISSSTAYLADGTAGLVIIDVSDPSQPVTMGTYDTPGYARDVFVDGSVAYVADGDSGLHIIDVSNPVAPTKIYQQDVEHQSMAVAVQDHIVYIAANFFGGLQIFNVSVPSVPLYMGFYDTPAYAYDVVVQGNLAYVADDWGGLLIIDVSNPALPVLVGDNSINVDGLFVQDTLIYTVELRTGLHVFNAANPANPVEIGSRSGLGYGPTAVVVDETTAYVAAGGNGLHMIDVADPTAPSLPDTYGGSVGASRVSVTGNLACATHGWGDFHVANISDPTDPVHLGTYDDTGSSAMDVCASGNLAYVVFGAGGLKIFDLSIPSSPAVVGSFMPEAYMSGVYVQGDYAYVAAGETFYVVDVSNAEHPTEVGVYDHGGYYMLGVFVLDTLAFVTCETSEYMAFLRILDISDPTNPVWLAGYWDGIDVFARDSLLYLVGWGLNVINMADAVNPALIGQADIGYASGISVQGDLAYVAVQRDGLKILDVSDPTDPFIVGEYDTPGSADDVTVRDSIVYVADEYSLLLLKTTEYTGCCLARGDMNHSDGAMPVDISDVVYLVNYIFLGGAPAICAEEADVDANGSIDIADLVYLVDFMFRGGPPPPECD